jgi:hypothetical protein
VIVARRDALFRRGYLMVIGGTLILALGAAALASALYVFISTGAWSWREFFALTALYTVILFVLLTGGAIRIG